MKYCMIFFWSTGNELYDLNQSADKECLAQACLLLGTGEQRGSWACLLFLKLGYCT